MMHLQFYIFSASLYFFSKVILVSFKKAANLCEYLFTKFFSSVIYLLGLLSILRLSLCSASDRPSCRLPTAHTHRQTPLSERRYWEEHQNLGEHVANLGPSRSLGGSPSG